MGLLLPNSSAIHITFFPSHLSCRGHIVVDAPTFRTHASSQPDSRQASHYRPSGFVTTCRIRKTSLSKGHRFFPTGSKIHIVRNFVSNRFKRGGDHFQEYKDGCRNLERRIGAASWIVSSSATRAKFSIDNEPETLHDGGTIVLVIGGGGREHALCYALQRSPSCDGVFCAPGNVGITAAGHATCISDLNISDSSAVLKFCKDWEIGLVVVGPEAPLVVGLVDDLVKGGFFAFGPTAAAAELEGSKAFMKILCDKYAIPTAKYQSFTNDVDAKRYIREQGVPIVVKVDGLAAGKGVVVAKSIEEAYDAVDSMLIKCEFGSAGSTIIIEECLEGEEVSFFALVDGETALPLASAQDHKRVGDGDTGPNTGGMGAYSPAPVLTPHLESLVMQSIIMPTVEGMAKEGRKFLGVLYAGLIIDSRTGLPKLLEYNVRFGDPECQVLMVRLKSDLVKLLLAACRGELNGVQVDWAIESALVVVMASKGYPGNYRKWSLIKNLDEAEMLTPGVKIFHAGTALDMQGNIIAVGGRVLGVTALGNDILEAQRRAYHAVDDILWPDGFCRRDIGWRAIASINAVGTSGCV